MKAKLYAFIVLETKEETMAIQGIPAEAVKYVLSTTEAQPEKGGMKVVSEDWGDMDEVDL